MDPPPPGAPAAGTGPHQAPHLLIDRFGSSFGSHMEPECPVHVADSSSVWSDMIDELIDLPSPWQLIGQQQQQLAPPPNLAAAHSADDDYILSISHDYNSHLLASSPPLADSEFPRFMDTDHEYSLLDIASSATIKSSPFSLPANYSDPQLRLHVPPPPKSPRFHGITYSHSARFSSTSNSTTGFPHNLASQPHSRTSKNLPKVPSAPQLTIPPVHNYLSSSKQLADDLLTDESVTPASFAKPEYCRSLSLIISPYPQRHNSTSTTHQMPVSGRLPRFLPTISHISPAATPSPSLTPDFLRSNQTDHEISRPIDSRSHYFPESDQHSSFPQNINFYMQPSPSSCVLQLPPASRQRINEAQDNGLQLVHLLLACAEAVARDEVKAAEEALIQLHHTVSTSGDSMQRVAAYFRDALHCKLSGATGRGGTAASQLALSWHYYDDSILEAYQILYQAFPYIKFAHFTANQAIFEAFEGEERVHIVDLEIVQGYQWPAFLQALAARPGGAPHVRITGVGEPLEVVEQTGRRLAELAASLHVPFEYQAVGGRLEDVKAEALGRRVGEALAVNAVDCLHRLLAVADNNNSPSNNNNDNNGNDKHKASNAVNRISCSGGGGTVECCSKKKALAAVLHMLWEQAPCVVTLVEREAAHNGPFFLGRFLEALHYYSAIFDSVDATLPVSSPERAKLERHLLARDITNIVACDGPARLVRHEKMDSWRSLMLSAGFHPFPLSANAINQSKLLLGLYPCDGYTLIEDKGCLQLGWQDRSIIGASAWRC